MGEERRLVLAAAHRHRRKERGVGLHEQAVVRRIACCLPHVFSGAECDDPGNGDHEAPVEQLALEGDRPCEAVDDAAVEVVLVQNAERGVVRIAGVDDDGKVQLPRQLQLGGEEVALRPCRLRGVVEVEPDFAYGGKPFAVVDDRREVVAWAWTVSFRLVTVEAKREADVRKGPAVCGEFRRKECGLVQRGGAAHRHHVRDAGGECARQRGGGLLLGLLKVGMRVKKIHADIVPYCFWVLGLLSYETNTKNGGS